jgi:hypothetical protein
MPRLKSLANKGVSEEGFDDSDAGTASTGPTVIGKRLKRSRKVMAAIIGTRRAAPIFLNGGLVPTE